MTARSTILVVDDTEANIDILVELLSDEYEVAVAMDGESALEILEEEHPNLILLDIMMPGIDGYEVCQRIKANERTWRIPIIFLTAVTDDSSEERGLSLGAVDYITKPFNPALVLARVKNNLALQRYQDHLEVLVRERTEQLELVQQVTFESLASLAEYRDPETGGHIHRTQHYTRILAEKLATMSEFEILFSEDVINTVYRSTPLHDIGKVGVPDAILLKPGKLTDEEFEEMKKHTIYGRDAIAAAEKRLGGNSFLKIAREIAESHHEKWDGSGYPLGIKEEEISVFGRLMAIADVYDALVCKRVYKPPFSHKKAASIIIEGAGTHFDPKMVEAFTEIQEEFRRIALEFAESDEEREALQSDE